MTIGEGPIYAVPNGLVFNVDGRVGAPPEAGTFTGFHCPDIPHNGVVVAAPRPAACASPHARCRRHVHLQAAGGACGSCGGATAPSGFLCTAAHNWMTAADCLCTILHQQVKVCTLHNTAGAGACTTVGCAHPLVPAYSCGDPTHWQDTNAVCAGGGGLCGLATQLVFACGANRHPVAATPCPTCGAGAAASATHACLTHVQSEHVAPGGPCPQCAQALVAGPRSLVQDWAAFAELVMGGVAVADPGGPPFPVNDQSIITRTVVTDTISGLITSDTTVVNPVNQAPLEVPEPPLPVIAPTTDSGLMSNPRTRTWVSGSLTLTSVKQTASVTVGTTRTDTTTITTSRTGNVQGQWAHLFAQQGRLYIYPVQPLPQAATVP
jgi:hypothetical protein